MQALNKEKEKSVKICLRCAALDCLKAGKTSSPGAAPQRIESTKSVIGMYLWHVTLY